MKLTLSIFFQIRKSILDLLFPIRCIFCRKHERWICEKCLCAMPQHSQFRCPMCGHFSFYGATCFECKEKSYLDGAWIVSDYNHSMINSSIKHFKYRGIQDLSRELSFLMLRFLQNNSIHKKFDCIIPVPLHTRRRLSRGFNQSELLARGIASYFKADVYTDILARIKATKPQFKLHLSKRKQNIHNAFLVAKKDDVIDKDILLVDDVMTTGNTLEECARVLHDAGAHTVWAIVLARGKGCHTEVIMSPCRGS